MNKLSIFPPELTRWRGLVLILTIDKGHKGITDFIAAQILHGSLFVIAGSEWLPSYELAHTLRKRTLEVRQSLSRLHTARTSTCYRLLDSLADLPSGGEPVLVLDFLHTFYDADIPLRVRAFKLRECCRQLKHLAFYRPVIVMTQDMPSLEDYEMLSPVLCSIADRTLTLEPELEQAIQPAFF